MKVKPPIERFMRKVDKRENGCWLWTGVTGGSKGAYGYFREGTRSTDPKKLAHRWLYEYLNGPIADGLELDHVKAKGCTSRLCVNPEHLEPVTHAENLRRVRLDVCKSGRHDLTDPANQQWDSQGNRRGCAECHRIKSRATYYRKKAKNGSM